MDPSFLPADRNVVSEETRLTIFVIIQNVRTVVKYRKIFTLSIQILK